MVSLKINSDKESTKVHVGQQAGQINQGSQAVALGLGAGQTNQGANCIAIGAYAGQTNQTSGSIVLNASGNVLNVSNVGVYIKPIRNLVPTSSPLVVYNSTTSELSTGIVNITVPGQITAASFVGDGSQLTNLPVTTLSVSNVQITSNTWTVLDDMSVSTTDGGFVIVNGSGFGPGSVVSVGTALATSTTYVSSIQLRSQLPAKSSGSYNVTVIRGDTSTATLPLSITYSATPVWGTVEDLGTVNPSTAFSRTLAATSDSSVTYSNITTLPPQTTLASNGTLTGNIVSGTVGTTYSFDVKATDAELQDALRTFLLFLKNWTQESKLIPTDSELNAYFGYSVSMSSDGTRVIVGAPYDDATGGADSGAAYVFSRSATTWTQESKLIPTDSEASAQFGYSVSMSSDGTRVIVGARYDDATGGADSGAAYVFSRSATTWTQESKLIPTDSEASAQFGFSVSMSNDGTRVIVGAYRDDATGGTDFNGGAAYVFSRSATTWTEESKLIPTDSEASAFFGFSVSMSNDGTRVIVGAYFDDATGAVNFNSGAAYVFSRSATTWTQESKLIPTDSEASALFGVSVNMSGDGTRVIVGAVSDDATGGADSGAAYVFSRSATTWTQESKLIPTDSEASAQFGFSVSMSNDGTRVIVGAYSDDATGGANSGAAYVFSRSATTWTEESKLIPTDSEASAQFGYSVSMSSDGTRVIVGAYLDDATGGADSGAAYVCEYNGSQWMIS